MRGVPDGLPAGRKQIWSDVPQSESMLHCLVVKFLAQVVVRKVLVSKCVPQVQLAGQQNLPPVAEVHTAPPLAQPQTWLAVPGLMQVSGAAQQMAPPVEFVPQMTLVVPLQRQVRFGPQKLPAGQQLGPQTV